MQTIVITEMEQWFHSWIILLGVTLAFTIRNLALHMNQREKIFLTSILIPGRKNSGRREGGGMSVMS
jgi:hypothetical protein